MLYKIMIAAVVAVGFACMANAAKLDLAGVDRTVTDVSELDGYDGVTNTSETQATLTFNLSDGVVQTYGGVISGNIKLVKQLVFQSNVRFFYPGFLNKKGKVIFEARYQFFSGIFFAFALF